MAAARHRHGRLGVKHKQNLGTSMAATGSLHGRLYIKYKQKYRAFTIKSTTKRYHYYTHTPQ